MAEDTWFNGWGLVAVGIVVLAVAGGGAFLLLDGGSNDTVLETSFDGDAPLSEWDTMTFGDFSGNVSADGKLTLSVVQCHTAVAARRVNAPGGPVNISLNWVTSAENWYEIPGWSIRTPEGEPVPFEIVEGKNISAPGRANTERGSLTARVDADSPLVVEFGVRPSGQCANFDHGRTTLRVDNLTIVRTGG